MDETNFLYNLFVMPSMMNHRAITSISIPMYYETTGLLTPKLGGATSIARRKQRSGRNVFLSDCGEFVIVHEFPVFDQNGGIGTLGDWVMGHATSQNPKIVIYRSHGKITIMNEDSPQPEYGRSRAPIPIPGATRSESGSDRGSTNHPTHYLQTSSMQSQWATNPQIVAEWQFPRDEIATQVKVSMDVGKGSDGNV